MKYDELFTIENLSDSHKKARAGRRKKQDVIDFELDLSYNLWSLYKQLKNRTYKVSGYKKFYVYEPKKREIQALSYADRVVQHNLCDLYLYPLLTSRFIYDNGACQKGKGTDFAIKRLVRFFVSQYKDVGTDGYIIKADIRKYFDNIDHEILKQRLAGAVKDTDILGLLYGIIDSFNADTGKGIPMGNQTSQLFALYYLDPLDRYIKETLRMPYYVRYMDDIIVLCDSKQTAKQTLKQMREIVENTLKLEFNQKTQICPSKNGVDFLGFHFYLTSSGKVIKRLRTQSKKKYKKRLKKMQTDFAEGRTELDDIKRSFAGFSGHLKRGHTFYMQKNALKNFTLIRRKVTIDEKNNFNDFGYADAVDIFADDLDFILSPDDG